MVFRLPAPPKTFELIFEEYDHYLRRCCRRYPTPRQVRSASLVALTDGWVFRSNSIHFSLLGGLALQHTHPERFLGAVMYSTKASTLPRLR